MLAFLAFRPIFPFVDLYLYVKGNVTQLLKFYRANQAPWQELLNYFLHLAELLKPLSSTKCSVILLLDVADMGSVKAVYLGLSDIW